jgi:hypothetical protein
VPSSYKIPGYALQCRIARSFQVKVVIYTVKRVRGIIFKYRSMFNALWVLSFFLLVLVPGVHAVEIPVFQWAVPSVGGITSPNGIACDTAGNIYATDPVNFSVWKFGPDGSFLMKWGSGGSGNGQFTIPWGVAVNSSGFVYVADAGSNRVQIFTPHGAYVSQWGTLGSASGKFNYPTGIAVNITFYVFVDV